MLQRKMTKFLKEWKETKDKECLLVKGARQVGKSYIIQAFGAQEYESCVTIDFIEQPQFRQVFKESLSADDIYRQLALLIPDIQLIPGKTLIFLDEIQECPEARSALKYLALDNQYDVIASGSLLGIVFRENSTSIPVGYVRQVEMFPLDFEEFLWARGYNASAIETLKEYFLKTEAVPTTVNENMMRLLREYCAIGGMPAVVEKFVEKENFKEAHEEQLKILASYEDDIAHYASTPERVKARACYLSLPRQLAKENTKFQYSVVEKRGSARKFESSVDWLENARLVLKCSAVSAMQFPLASYEIGDKFRLYANDTGLLMAMLGYEMIPAVVENTLKGPMKGGLYENLVASMLVKSGRALRYWINNSATSEIEFLIEKDASVVPVEVKSSRGTTASLNAALERPDIKRGYKLIDGNVGESGKKITLPLYMAMFL